MLRLMILGLDECLFGIGFNFYAKKVQEKDMSAANLKFFLNQDLHRIVWDFCLILKKQDYRSAQGSLSIFYKNYCGRMTSDADLSLYTGMPTVKILFFPTTKYGI